MYDIIIFGGGVSGLTIAHEATKRGLRVILVEKDNDFGGMVRSNVEHNQFPSEHSWRGYAPFYKNTFQLMKEIPYNNTTTFDNLSKPIDFFLLSNEEGPYKPTMTIMDYMVLNYLGITYLLAGERKKDYYQYNIEIYTPVKLIMIFVIDIKMSAHKREPLIPEFRKSN